MTTSLTHPRQAPVGRPLQLAAVLLVLLVLLAACTAADDTTDSSASPVGRDDAEVAASPAAPGDDDDFGFGEDADAESPAEGGDAAADQAVPPVDTDTASTGERIIKEGTVTLQVDPGQFDTAFGQVIVRAQELGGHVVGSSSSTERGPDEEVLVSGQVTVRVPVRNFEDLLRIVGEAGEVIDRNVTSQDVTAEFVDLESRRRHLQAQERFYLGLLNESETVQDAIAVQQQLDGIQRQIEEITGRLNLLQDRTAFSTLTVRIQEQGATSTLAESSSPGGLTPYVEQAVDTFIATVGSLIVVGTFLVPFLVLGLIAYGIWRSVRRRRAPQQPRGVPPGPGPTGPHPGAPYPGPHGGAPYPGPYGGGPPVAPSSQTPASDAPPNAGPTTTRDPSSGDAVTDVGSEQMPAEPTPQ